MFHFVEGTLAQLDGNNEDALKHFRIAKSEGLDSPGILNNLAIEVAADEDGDLEEALSLANAALDLLPDHPYVLETRGQILLKLKRHEEAIRDLEKSLLGVSDLRLQNQILPSLIEAYEAIGLNNMAERYRQRSEQAEQQIKAQMPSN